MKWYAGGIAEAVTFSKQKGAIFVVYVEGKEDDSKKLTHLVNLEGVSSILESQNFVSIKIEAGSTPHQQFSEIYTGVPVPSIHFMGKTGIPLEIITDVKDAVDLVEKINSVLRKSGISVPSLTAADKAKLLEEAMKVTNQTLDSRTPDVCKGSGSEEKKPEICKVEEPRHDEKTVKSSEESSSKEESLEVSSEEKVQRVKELIEQQRLAKEKEEEEKERQKEIERRKMGQSVQQLKKWQEDQKTKEILEERDRERRENRLARERVLAQIAQDKAERAVKFGSSPPPAPTQSPAAMPPQRPPVNYNVAKLMFKLPEGDSLTREFECADTLQCVREYLSGAAGVSPSTHVLSTSFPKREFTTEDNPKTLNELGLVPNAVILVRKIPGNAITTASAVDGITAFMWSLLSPVLFVFNYFRGLIFGKRNDAPPRDSVKRPAERQSGEPSVAMKRPRDSTVIKRHGNVHRLHDRRDSDDENNTWNGNSTQQM